jgi:S-methylmethionine-dependent homocysteine/selenocysteine methylase
VDTFADCLARGSELLSQAGGLDGARHLPAGPVDPHIGSAASICSDEKRQALVDDYDAAMRQAAAVDRPFLALTPTRWANAERVGRSRFWERSVNGDHVRLIHDVVASLDTNDARPPVLIGGVIGPKASEFNRSDALSRQEALAFHRLQAEALARAGVDGLVALWQPALDEALGLADAFAATGLPYVMSLAVDDDDRLPDGADVGDVITTIDDEVASPPVIYFASPHSAVRPSIPNAWRPWCLHRRELCWLHVGPSRRASVTSPR